MLLQKRKLWQFYESENRRISNFLVFIIWLILQSNKLSTTTVSNLKNCNITQNASRKVLFTTMYVKWLPYNFTWLSQLCFVSRLRFRNRYYFLYSDNLQVYLVCFVIRLMIILWNYSYSYCNHIPPMIIF